MVVWQRHVDRGFPLSRARGAALGADRVSWPPGRLGNVDVRHQRLCSSNLELTTKIHGENKCMGRR